MYLVKVIVNLNNTVHPLTEVLHYSGNPVKTLNGIMFDFYLGLPYL